MAENVCVRPGCGKAFSIKAWKNQYYCCAECYHADRTRVAREGLGGKMLVPQKGMAAQRMCHDCGRATHNYRCPECLLAWRKKYGVSEHAA